MTKREEYAKAALTGFLSHPDWSRIIGDQAKKNGSELSESLAIMAFASADAMLEKSGESQAIVLTDTERESMLRLRTEANRGMLNGAPLGCVDSLLGLAERIAAKENA